MISCSEWTGVRLSHLLDYVGVKPEGKWILAKALTRQVCRVRFRWRSIGRRDVCYAQNGEPLRPEQGYPVRLMVPGWEGNVSIKWLRRIEVGDQPGITVKRL